MREIQSLRNTGELRLLFSYQHIVPTGQKRNEVLKFKHFKINTPPVRTCIENQNYINSNLDLHTLTQYLSFFKKKAVFSQCIRGV